MKCNITEVKSSVRVLLWVWCLLFCCVVPVVSGQEPFPNLDTQITQITGKAPTQGDYTIVSNPHIRPLSSQERTQAEINQLILLGRKVAGQNSTVRQICGSGGGGAALPNSALTLPPAQAIQRRVPRSRLLSVQQVRQSGELSWDWSPPAEWHKQVVKIHNPFYGDRGYGYKLGSGVYVQYNGISGILTAAHVVDTNLQESPKIFWSDGKVTQAHVHHRTRDRNYRPGSGNTPGAWDTGWIHAHHPSIQPLELATAVQGPVEMNGHGGKGEAHRHWWGTTELIDGNLVAISKMSALYGDSGGPWVQRGKVVAVSSEIAVDREVDTDQGRLAIGTMTQATPVQAVMPFLDRVRLVQGFR